MHNTTACILVAVKLLTRNSTVAATVMPAVVTHKMLAIKIASIKDILAVCFSFFLSHINSTVSSQNY
jgi:hypothetical protein